MSYARTTNSSAFKGRTAGFIGLGGSSGCVDLRPNSAPVQAIKHMTNDRFNIELPQYETIFLVILAIFRR